MGIRCTRLPALLLLQLFFGFHSPPAVGAPFQNSSASLPNLERRAVQALASRADAESLAAAAALRFKQPGSPDATELAMGAAEKAPQNPVIGWLFLQLCAQTPACNFPNAATTLRWVDADNGASWLPVLAAAYRDRDRLEVDRVLGDMARAKEFNLYRNSMVVLLADALYRSRGALPRGFAQGDADRLDIANGFAADIVPAFAPLTESCRAAAAASERREVCLKLSATMQRSDAIAAQEAGFDIEKHLTAAESKEGRATSERRRVLAWRAMASARADSTVLPWLKNARARRRLAQMRASPRQEDLFIAILREHKLPLQPTEMHP